MKNMKLFICTQFVKLLLKLHRRILFVVFTILLTKYKKAPKHLILKSVLIPLGSKEEDLEDLMGDIWDLEQDIKFTY